MKKLVYFIVLAVVTTITYADSLYKVVGADGTITFTNRPPTEGKITALKFDDAPSSPLSAQALKSQADLRKSIESGQGDRTRIDSTGSVTLFSATWCGYCRKAKSYLHAKGIRYQEYDIDTPEGLRVFSEAGGEKGVPLLVADSKRLQGFSEGSYDVFFAAKK